MAESDDGASKDFIILDEPMPALVVKSESEVSSKGCCQMHHSFPAHQGFQRTSKGSHLSRVSAAAIKHDSSPLLQIQTHSLCAFRGRESGFDTYHPHFVLSG